MRGLITIIFLLLSTLAVAEEFIIFEKNGYFGIRDQGGQVTVPAVYEKLGWSDGSAEVRDGVIGFREGKLWGLISVKNKALTEEKYYTIIPFGGGLFKASIKGKFSNQLFHGVLDAQGKIVVSFHYFTIDPIGEQLLVSTYESSRQKFGIVSLKNESLIPSGYHEIYFENGFFIAKSQVHTLDIYSKHGGLLESSLDSIRYDEGWVCFRHGKAGFISTEGVLSYSFEYKDFQVENGIVFPIPFPEWHIFERDQLLLTVKADSVNRDSRNFWVSYLNGAHQVILSKDIDLGRDNILVVVSADYLILKNSKTLKWSVLNHKGGLKLDGYDSIALVHSTILAKRKESWSLVNSSGSRLNRFNYQKIQQGQENQFVVKRNEHWGIAAASGQEITSFKYDTIHVAGQSYAVGYLNRWGLMDVDGEWLIRPEFAEVFAFKDVLVGRRGQGYTYFSSGAEFKSTFRPIQQLGDFLMVEDAQGKKGLINSYGELQYYPEFDEINLRNMYLELRSEAFVELIGQSGEIIIGLEDQVQEVKANGGDLIAIKRDNRWGYVDNKGRLRVSNRYEEAKPFSEGLAAVMLRGKWGFIDKEERLAIQPYYFSVEPFIDDLCIVKTGQGMGLIDTSGHEVIASEWSLIERLSSGNYRISKNGKVGLVAADGRFLLRPAFESLEDFNGKVIVTKDNKYGLLDYQGNQLFKLEHKEIKISGSHTLLKY